MTSMLRKALWDIRWTAFWYAVGGASYVLLLSFFYPMIRQQSQQFAQILANYPKGVLTALGYSNITSFSGYLGGEALNLFWPIIIAVFATLGGASLVAKEVEDGTSEIWLSIPRERWRLLLAKMGALAIGLAGAVVLCAVAVQVGAWIDSATVSVSGLLAMAVVMGAFLLVIAAYSSLLSSLFSSRGVAAGISLGLTLLFYALWLVGGLADSWKALKDLSIWTAYTPQKALESGTVDLLPVVIVLGLAAACVTGSLYAFQRRDAI